jgi:hypothetical protein
MSLTGFFLIGRRSHVAHPSDNQSSSCRQRRCSAASAHAKPCRPSCPAIAPHRHRSLRRHGLSRRSSKSAVSVSSMAVLPHLISGQFVEHCKLSVLQRIQRVSSPHFLRDIQTHSLVILVRDLRPSSTVMGFEQIQRVSCPQLTQPPVYIEVGHNMFDGVTKTWHTLFRSARP